MLPAPLRPHAVRDDDVYAAIRHPRGPCVKWWLLAQLLRPQAPFCVGPKPDSARQCRLRNGELLCQLLWNLIMSLHERGETAGGRFRG